MGVLTELPQHLVSPLILPKVTPIFYTDLKHDLDRNFFSTVLGGPFNWANGYYEIATSAGESVLRCDVNRLPQKYRVSVLVNNLATGQDSPHPGIVVRFSDVDNYDAVYIRAASDEVVRWRKVGGSATVTTIGATSIPHNAWVPIDIFVYGTNAHVWVNRTYITAIANVVAGDRIGLWGYSGDATLKGRYTHLLLSII